MAGQEKVKIKVICTEPTEPFIYWIHGAVTKEQYESIESELLEQLEKEIIEASARNQSLVVEATYIPSETQYGTGYGDVHYLPAYWSLIIIGHE